MPYIIETFDKPDSLALRKSTRDEHLDYLDANMDRLLACGAKLKDDGSDAGGGLYIVDVETRAEAEAFIAADPFSKAGLFERVQISRWRKGYLDGKSFFPPRK
ncbi:YciI family protein [Roseomonas sp. M0104]|uniref:YciI family protein n=1 Tax=Teichococcus coralli TaxID=2545983 RepID=A0A845BB06_9PROT|nr:YciI family protein [Pseudoroseomonas coralli]MXP62552.1 YciI family protein [Pseudoroseomonas coralli]